jgi:hypothetical protein
MATVTTSLVRCSAECLSRDIDVLMPVGIFMDGFTLDVNKDCLQEHYQGRYISTNYTILSSGLAQLCVSAYGHEYLMVLKSIEPWPPSLKNLTALLTVIIKLGMSFSFGREVVQLRPPWPPPTQWVMPITSDQLRPIP